MLVTSHLGRLPRWTGCWECPVQSRRPGSPAPPGPSGAPTHVLFSWRSRGEWLPRGAGCGVQRCQRAQKLANLAHSEKKRKVPSLRTLFLTVLKVSFCLFVCFFQRSWQLWRTRTHTQDFEHTQAGNCAGDTLVYTVRTCTWYVLDFFFLFY